MKKTLIAVAVIAAGAAGYYFKFGPGAAGQDSAVLEYVPADTVLLSAQLKPINMADYLASLGLFPQYYGAESQKSIQDLIATTTEPGMKFMLSLALSYMQAFEKPQELEKITGLKLSMRQLMYMVGVSPVVKLEVANEAAMWAMFDKAEKDSGYQHKTGTVGAINYRKYTFTMPEAELDLVVSVNNGWATIVLTSSKLDAANLSIALGATKPAQSVVSSGKLKELSTKYQLSNESFGYISSQELVKALNSKDGNQLAKDVETLFGAEAGVALASWREPACQTDTNAIAASWPGMFIDSSFTIAASGMEGQSRIQIPTENKVTIEGLNLLRGFIPQQQLKLIGDKQMMNFAMGLDVAQMAVGVGKLWEVATTTTYTCPALVEMQTELKASNPMGALAMAGMAGGVQGVSMSLNSMKMDAATQMPTEADAALVLSVANARTFFEGIKAMAPPLAAITLPADGAELDLATAVPEMAMTGLKPKLIASDSHIAVYVGEQAKAQATATVGEKLAKNGLMAMGLDYASFFELMKNSMEASGQPVPPEVAGMMNMNMKNSTVFDVNNHGLVITSTVKLAAPATK